MFFLLQKYEIWQIDDIFGDFGAVFRECLRYRRRHYYYSVMRKTLYFVPAVMLVIPLVLLSASCSKSAFVPDDGTDAPLNLTKAEIGIIDASGTASFDLFRKTYQADTDTKNVLVSPLSLQIALMMCANGAAGETYDQIVSAIGYGDYPVADLNRVYRQLSTGLSGVDHLSTLELANSGWVRERKGFSLLDDYVSAVESSYNGVFRTLDFSLPSSADVINGWCSQKTHGLISKVIDRIPASTLLYLINALYFKSDWSSKFDVSDTYPQDFTDLSGNTGKVDMMHQTHDYYGYETETADMCEFPFGNGSFCLDIILPEVGTDFGLFAGAFGYADYMKMVNNMREVTYKVSLPKFDIDYSTGDLLETVLPDMGMVLPFTDAADFSGMSDTPLCVSSVTQNCRFKIDEKGGEAAAVTVINMKETAIGPGSERKFTADHPFIYVLREKTSGIILFIGAYTCKE